MWELLTGEEPYDDLHYGAIIGNFPIAFHSENSPGTILDESSYSITTVAGDLVWLFGNRDVLPLNIATDIAACLNN